MAIRPTDPKVLAGAQAELIEHARRTAPSHSVRNAAAVVELSSPQRFSFRGRLFEVPPLGFKKGIELQEIAMAIESMTDQPTSVHDYELMLALFEDAVALFWSFVKPVHWFSRMFWRWRGNPFANAEIGEVAELLGFFLPCRMRSSVQVEPSGFVQRRRKQLLLTRQTTSPDLFKRSRAGLTRKVTQ